MRWLGSLVALSTSLPGWVLAHPVDKVVQGTYLTLAPSEVRLGPDLAPGSEVAGDVLQVLDSGGDGAVSGNEGQAFTGCAGLVHGGPRRQDGGWVLLDVSAPPLDALVTGSAILKILAAPPRSDTPGDHVLVYWSRYEPAKSLWMANVFLQPGPDSPSPARTAARTARGDRSLLGLRAMRRLLAGLLLVTPSPVPFSLAQGTRIQNHLKTVLASAEEERSGDVT